MSTIRSLHTVLADQKFRTEELIPFIEEWTAHDRDLQKLALRFLRSSLVEERSFVDAPEIITGERGLAERSERFDFTGKDLALNAARGALKGIPPEDIDVLIVASCTAPNIPSLDSLLIPELGLRPTIRRIPIFQYGCIGGASGLSLAHELTQSGNRVLLVSVEICSLLFHKKIPNKAALVGAALFGDGAAAVVLEPEDNGGTGLATIDRTATQLITNSRELMGYDTLDDGFYLRLSPDLPKVVLETATNTLRHLFEERGCTEKSFDGWLVHPGGVKILNTFQETFALTEEQIGASFEVLRTRGNISSSSVFFVLEEHMKRTSLGRDHDALMLGIGPGLFLETLFMRVFAGEGSV